MKKRYRCPECRGKLDVIDGSGWCYNHGKTIFRFFMMWPFGPIGKPDAI